MVNLKMQFLRSVIIPVTNFPTALSFLVSLLPYFFNEIGSVFC